MGNILTDQSQGTGHQLQHGLKINPCHSARSRGIHAASGFRDYARNDSLGHFTPFVCNDNPGAGYAWNKSGLFLEDEIEEFSKWMAE
jgi:hypothetical protein